MFVESCSRAWWSPCGVVFRSWWSWWGPRCL